MTAEFHAVVAKQSAWQKTGFGQHLETVANTKNVFALLQQPLRTSSSPVQIGQSLRNAGNPRRRIRLEQECSHMRKVGRRMPYIVNRLTNRIFYRFIAVDIAVEPGNTRTAKFMRDLYPFQFETVVFDDRIRQQLLAHALRASASARSFVSKLKLQVFTDANFANFVEAHRMKCALHCVPCGSNTFCLIVT